jgi:hypothetical protein
MGVTPRGRRSAVLAAICLLFVQSVSTADEPADRAPLARGLDLNNELDRKLQAYCDGAILRSRGLACSPLAGSTDRWILEHLVPQPAFLQALDGSGLPELGEPIKVDSRAAPRRRNEMDDIVQAYQSTRTYSSKLEGRLSAAQRQRLPLVYLNAEGLMALCRPEFAAMLESAETPGKIRELANTLWRDEASPLHRALFTLTSLDEAPTLELQLRSVAYKLDCRIVDLLTEEERKKLVELLGISNDLRRVAHGAPSF